MRTLLPILFSAVVACGPAELSSGRCDGPDDCASGLCIDGTCRTPDAGSSCSADDDCPNGSCVAGACTTDEADAGTYDAFRPDMGPCREVEDESTLEPVPVDIIITIDNSGSMTQEAAEVQANINNFAAILAASGLDYRVVLISEPTGSTGVCVPAPLGSGAPACESGPEGRLRAIHRSVSSRNALSRMLEFYPDYVDFLRFEAAKVFLWITDDEASNHSPDEFRAELAALEPAGMFDLQFHNAIVGYFGEAAGDWNDRGAGSCGSLARVGETYLHLAQCLDDARAPIEGCIPGRQARVCETDWSPIFDAIAEGVLAGVPVECAFEVPAPPEGMGIDTDEVVVAPHSPGMGEYTTTQVADEASCVDGGWYFDDLAAPTTITLCPSLCSTLQADEGAAISIRLGCFTMLE